ncbi:ParA family protein [Parapedobacter sp. 10938]|uniref:ParA family protein n=1 Tax=Parapedobacter flavus TaxID=3110225 RepID=UPI002DB72913|nr:division plane positioning ATPase MipZ [Parapedobacter sp. 10938]MEC3881825.1 division plane positioning ATPase MipZ [Parapedobacter sp. 10938]
MIVSIANQKGGAQKTTLTSLLATTVHYSLPQANVAVIDADIQSSIFNFRKREMAAMERDSSKKEKFEQIQEHLGKEMFPIVRADAESGGVLDAMQDLQEKGYNMILVDMPGTIQAGGLFDIYRNINYLFIPLDCDDQSQDSTFSFLKKIKELILDNGDLEHNMVDYSLFFTKHEANPILRSHKKFERLRASLKAQDIHLLDNVFPNSDRWRTSITSTVLPFPQLKKYESISPYPLMKEIIKFVNR